VCSYGPSITRPRHSAVVRSILTLAVMRTDTTRHPPILAELASVHNRFRAVSGPLKNLVAAVASTQSTSGAVVTAVNATRAGLWTAGEAGAALVAHATGMVVELAHLRMELAATAPVLQQQAGTVCKAEADATDAEAAARLLTEQLGRRQADIAAKTKQLDATRALEAELCRRETMVLEEVKAQTAHVAELIKTNNAQVGVAAVAEVER
jgi:hypothetical protein